MKLSPCTYQHLYSGPSCCTTNMIRNEAQNGSLLAFVIRLLLRRHRFQDALVIISERQPSCLPQALSASPHWRLLRAAAVIALALSVPLFLIRFATPLSLNACVREHSFVQRPQRQDAQAGKAIIRFTRETTDDSRHCRHWRAASAMAAAAMPPAVQASIAKGAAALGLPPEVLLGPFRPF